MGYKILYEPIHGEKYPAKLGKSNTAGILYTVICAAIIVALLSVPQVKSALKRAMIPGDPVITEQAATEFMDGLRAGTPFKEAVTAFCLEILNGAEAKHS